MKSYKLFDEVIYTDPSTNREQKAEIIGTLYLKKNHYLISGVAKQVHSKHLKPKP